MICTFAIGIKLIDFSKARDPSLVYDCGEADYANLLDGQGFNKVSFYDLKNEPKNNFHPWELNYLPSWLLSQVMKAIICLHITRRFKHVRTQDFIQRLHSAINMDKQRS